MKRIFSVVVIATVLSACVVQAEVFIDGKLLIDHTDKKDDVHKSGGVGVGGMKCKAQFRNMKLTDEAGKVLFGDR